MSVDPVLKPSTKICLARSSRVGVVGGRKVIVFRHWTPSAYLRSTATATISARAPAYTYHYVNRFGRRDRFGARSNARRDDCQHPGSRNNNNNNKTKRNGDPNNNNMHEYGATVRARVYTPEITHTIIISRRKY